MARRSKSPFAVGARVVVTRPDVFKRVGYPLTPEVVREEVRAAATPHVTALLKACGVNDGTPQMYREVETILMRVAFLVVKKRGFGGRERRVYPDHEPFFMGMAGTIVAVRFVQTGVYEPAVHYGTADGYESDPPHLARSKANRLADVRFDAGHLRTFQVENLKLEGASGGH